MCGRARAGADHIKMDSTASLPAVREPVGVSRPVNKNPG